VGIFITFSLSSTFGSSAQNVADNINSAGKGRMLIQKMTKEALLIESNLDREDGYQGAEG